MKRLPIFAAAILASVFLDSVIVQGQTSADHMGPAAKAELDKALDILSSRHINRGSVDWAEIRQSAYILAANAETASDAYPVIYAVIKRLGEKHTHLVTASVFQAEMTGAAVNGVKPPPLLMPTSTRLSDSMLMVTVPGFSLGEDANRKYVSALRTAFNGAASEHICRFIVDLRGNTGGSMGPMIAGTASLLGRAPYGYWSDGVTIGAPWDAPDHPLVLGQNTPPTPYAEPAIPRDHVFTAVLIDSRTASAGEDTAVAFKGVPNVRFFGENSAGYVTANTTDVLPDGAALAVSVAWIADRNKHIYRDYVSPDEMTPPGEATVGAAKAWLDKQVCDG